MAAAVGFTLSTYDVLGIPDTIGGALVLICLSLVLARWFGGLEIGPLKVPTLDGQQSSMVRRIAPVFLLVSLLGFLPVWSKNSEIGLDCWDQYQIDGDVSKWIECQKSQR